MDVENLFEELKDTFENMVNALNQEDEEEFTENCLNFEYLTLSLIDADDKETLSDEKLEWRTTLLYRLLHELTDFKIAMVLYDDDNMVFILKKMETAIMELTNSIPKQELKERQEFLKAEESLRKALKDENAENISKYMNELLDLKYKKDQ